MRVQQHGVPTEVTEQRAPVENKHACMHAHTLMHTQLDLLPHLLSWFKHEDLQLDWIPERCSRSRRLWRAEKHFCLWLELWSFMSLRCQPLIHHPASLMCRVQIQQQHLQLQCHAWPGCTTTVCQQGALVTWTHANLPPLFFASCFEVGANTYWEERDNEWSYWNREGKWRVTLGQRA